MKGAVLCAALALGGPVVGQDAEADDGAVPEAQARAVPVSVAAEVAELADLEALDPQRARRKVLGRSHAGLELGVAVLSHSSGGPVEQKPGLWIVNWSSPEEDGAECVLALGRWLLERAADDPAVDGLLETRCVYLSPSLDPDRAQAADERPRFDRNFPILWQPDRFVPGSGLTPLSRPETLSAARFLGSRDNVIVTVALGVPEEGSDGGPDRSPVDEDADAFARLAELARGAGLGVVAWPSLPGPGGAFDDYAYRAHGSFPFRVARGELEPEAWAERTGRFVLALLAMLPRVELVSLTPTRLGSDLWQLDFGLTNSGGLATQSRLAERRGLVPPLWLEVTGADVLAAAARERDGATFAMLPLGRREGRHGLSERYLGPGETRSLRLVLEAPADARVALACDSPWAPQVRTELVLDADE